jgi:RecA-family ATPase
MVVGNSADHLSIVIPIDAYCDDAAGLHQTKNARPSDTLSAPAISDWDVADRFVGDPPPREWLVQGVFPKRTVGLVAGGGGIGKSLLLGDVATKVAAFDGLEKPIMISFGQLAGGGKVVILGAEDDAIEVHLRYRSMGVEVPTGRMFWLPLPDAGGVMPLFGFAPYGGKTPITTRYFDEFFAQLLKLNALALVIVDPLQAFSGGLDLNDAGHCQFVGTAFGRVAAECGCTVILTHHVRKTKIQNVDEAREAVRGSGGLIDAVRAAVVVWPLPDDDAVKVCRKLGAEHTRNKVANLAVVKANFKADWTVKTLVRDESGLLFDRTADLTQDVPNYGALLNILVLAIDGAAAENKPFTKSGEHGVYERRAELGGHFEKWGGIG